MAGKILPFHLDLYFANQQLELPLERLQDVKMEPMYMRIYYDYTCFRLPHPVYIHWHSLIDWRETAGWPTWNKAHSCESWFLMLCEHTLRLRRKEKK